MMVNGNSGAGEAGLPPKVSEILASIQDAELKGRVEGVVQRALSALEAAGKIHLPQDNFEEGDDAASADDDHLELAPYVLAAVSGVNHLLRFVVDNFPAPTSAAEEQDDDDFDLEFDLVDGPTGDGEGLSQFSSADSGEDLSAQAIDAVHAFAGMLRSRVVQLGERFEFALKQEDRWSLLAEIDDQQHRLNKALQGVLFGVLSVFTVDARREEIFPAYVSAVSESVRLRSAVAELSHHIGRFNAAVSEASPEMVVPLLVAVADRLTRFSSRPEYRTLRAEDKRAVIDFRATLHSLRHSKEGVPMLPLRHAVEGFSKFLEAMSAINHREVLVIHDRQRLSELIDRTTWLMERAEEDPEVAGDGLPSLMEELRSVVGRSPDLDQLQRDLLLEIPEPNMMVSTLLRCRDTLEMTLATVG